MMIFQGTPHYHEFGELVTPFEGASSNLRTSPSPISNRVRFLMIIGFTTGDGNRIAGLGRRGS